MMVTYLRCGGIFLAEKGVMAKDETLFARSPEFKSEFATKHIPNLLIRFFPNDKCKWPLGETNEQSQNN